MKQNQFLEIYSKFLQKFLAPQKSLKVVFDCSNGIAGLVLKQLKIENCKLKIINSNPDGNFPAHGPDSSKPGAIKQLQATVKKYKADLGIIFDGDADRVLFIDNLGRSIDPDIIARLLIWYLKPQKMIISIVAGWLVKKLKIKNLKIIGSQVGHLFIEKKMVSERADLGFEYSGHYYFKKFFYLDSGILAAIEVINAVSRLPYKFSDFIDLLPPVNRQQINFPLNQLKFRTKTSLLKKIETRYQPLGISRLGGLRMEFPDWWFSLHFSQTEPLLRLNIEAVKKSQLQKQILKLKKILL